MSKHTPGPWTRIAGERFKHDSSAGVHSSGGTYIAAALDLNRYDRDEEVEANARLIAAAPELLEACKYVVRWHREHDSGEGELFGLDFVTTCIAAIDKAEGKEIENEQA